MICYHCNNASSCSLFRELYSISDDFDIKQCKAYADTDKYKYKLIAKNEDLMRLIYDYFTDQVEGDYSEEYIRKCITNAMWNL